MTTQPTPEEAQDNKDRADFQVGGQDRTLSKEEQLTQLGSYLDAHYPLPDFRPPWAGGAGDPTAADAYIARLPDRTTHAAMLMLGSAVDHTMPGVVYLGEVSSTEAPEISARVFHPSQPTPGAWAISLHSGGWWRGAADALEFSWRPEVAAAAELSGTTIIDLDHPLAPEHTVAQMCQAVEKAVAYAHEQGATHITIWGYSSGGALAALNAAQAHALVLTFPDLGSLAKLPEEIRAGKTLPEPHTWPESLVQVASFDEIAAAPEGLEEEKQIEVRHYVSRHRISTPEVAREKIRDVAEFLRAISTHR